MFVPAAQIFHCLDHDTFDDAMEARGTKRSASSAAEPAKKLPVLPFGEVDVAKLVAKDAGRDKDARQLISASYEGLRLAVNLTPEKESWLQLPFGLQRNTKFAKEQDASGGEYETLPMDVQLDDETARALKDIDEAMKEQVLSILPSALWHGSVRHSDGYPDRLHVKLVSKSSRPNDLTALHVRPFGKPSVKGAGDEFLKPLLETGRNFRNAKVKVAVLLQKIWVMKEKDKVSAGITWRAISVIADLPEQIQYGYEDVFGDDVFDEA